MEAEPDGLALAGLISDASTASGLTDWGEHTFFPTVELLVESCRATAGLTATGRVSLRKVILRHLRNQLYLQAYLTARPDLVLAPIDGPVVITGLPRTGTTLLHNLMALDPTNRVLRLWEALHPVPFGAEEAVNVEVAVKRAGTWLEGFYRATPSFRAIHALTPRGPEECDALLQNSFASQHFDDMFRAEAYSAWLNNAELGEEYGYFARQLEVLSSGDDPGLQWVLKSPSHLGYLDTVERTFPGALVVQCHRNPDEAIASYASLTMAVRSPHAEHTAPFDVGCHVLNRCARAMQRALEVRDRRDRAGFLDVAYSRLVREPLAVVGDIYRRLDRPFSAEASEAMQSWLSANPQHKHGRHDYDLSRFGLASEQISSALGAYSERFAAEIG